jgi:hypothetical protein
VPNFAPPKTLRSPTLIFAPSVPDNRTNCCPRNNPPVMVFHGRWFAFAVVVVCQRFLIFFDEIFLKTSQFCTTCPPLFISQNTKTNNQQGNPLYPLPPSDSTPQHDPPSVENGVAAAFQKCDHRLPMFPFASVLIFFFLFFPIDVHPL